MATPSPIDLLESGEAGFPLGFPIVRDAFEAFEVEELIDLASRRGREFALRALAERLLRRPEALPFQSMELLILALLFEIQRYVALDYDRRQLPGVLDKALSWADEQHPGAIAPTTVARFVELFPPERELERGRTASELLLLALAAENPAARPFHPLFDDEALRSQSPYPTLVEDLEAFFETQPPVRGSSLTLVKLLRAPIAASPNSLAGQLRYLLDNYTALLPGELRRRLLMAADILREETRLRGIDKGAPPPVLEFHGRQEYEAFTDDRAWMADVVLIAKQTHVWLFQLSRQYGREIRRLDEIPDEELDRLARWGITGLWLIGIWERSEASRAIKQRMGNAEALPSAYSIYDYRVAGDLGGEEAAKDLAWRAGQRNIRLATDMVPNHWGLDSRWVREHPDWLLGLDHPPYPNYTFHGPNLSGDPGVGLHIEDGYWHRSDAAVVFKRVDHGSGRVRYLYHGNDGTDTPWNDTAQIDYLHADAREAIIQTILGVAQRFPVIRFDAAMTLAKQHIQRLWFPPPGEGGAIPSRAAHGVTADEFDRLMPKEFWREVVDRIQAEAPDTLLIAEAFWLLEGYFVRTLGMHRVYNSAFMNMLKMERNAEYRQTVRNVLEFSPQVLQRFVNFMNNPDEETAVAQFGKGDKYFGIAVMLVTMPGLPMIGHGQVEAFTEKYGMEYGRSYVDESADEECVRRHEREVFPLMRRRQLFSRCESFAFYDFETGGGVDENVFAYSNRSPSGERALIVFNNAYPTTSGHVRTSTALNVASGDDIELVRRPLHEALDLELGDALLYRFRDHRTGLEYLRYSRDIADRGLLFELQGYQYYALLDWQPLVDDGLWGRVAQRLDGQGTPSLEDARRDLELEPISEAFREVLAELEGEPAELRQKLRAFLAAAEVEGAESLVQDVWTVDALLERALLVAGFEDDLEETLPEASKELVPLLTLLAALPGEPLETWRLGRTIGQELSEETAGLLALLAAQDAPAEPLALFVAAREAELLGVNRWKGVDWFVRESALALIDAQLVAALVAALRSETPAPEDLSQAIEQAESLRAAVAESGFQLAVFLDLIGKPAEP